MIRWMAEQLHRLARWLEQLGTEPVFYQLPGWPEPIDAAGWLTISKAGVGLGGEEIGE